ncbi:hypothetical protein FDUTEX481_07363 [Tolypothrix sp. PCC 7601]|nr:hypothetical protein FDUTEX481_07363 [Tolypothrix sp. PCC 7601]
MSICFSLNKHWCLLEQDSIYLIKLIFWLAIHLKITDFVG